MRNLVTAIFLISLLFPAVASWSQPGGGSQRLQNIDQDFVQNLEQKTTFLGFDGSDSSIMVAVRCFLPHLACANQEGSDYTVGDSELGSCGIDGVFSEGKTYFGRKIRERIALQSGWIEVVSIKCQLYAWDSPAVAEKNLERSVSRYLADLQSIDSAIIINVFARDQLGQDTVETFFFFHMKDARNLVLPFWETHFKRGQARVINPEVAAISYPNLIPPDYQIPTSSDAPATKKTVSLSVPRSGFGLSRILIYSGIGVVAAGFALKLVIRKLRK